MLLCLLLVVVPTFAQSGTPSVSVSNQVLLNGTVIVDRVYSEGQGFVVIHIDVDGAPNRVAGFAPVEAGWTYNLQIPIDATVATPVLYAMLHLDDNEVGAYEFGTVEGADAPVSVDGQVVTPPFNVDIISAFDQIVDGDSVTIASVTAQADGWLVIHSDANGAPGPVLGQTQVLAGTTNNVVVELQADGRTPVLWPMLHVDTGTPGEYEFGIVEGADGPVIVRGTLATMSVWTVPHVRVPNQTVIHGDGQGDPNNSLVVDSVLAEVAGFLVVHVDNAGAPGPVAGFVAVPQGLSTNLTIDGLDTSILTPVLWPMLHVDTGTVGEYEFGVVEGADGPVLVNDQVLTFPINAAPSLVLTPQDPLEGESTGTVRFTVTEALIDAHGWLAIHNNTDDAPGPVLTTAELHPGSNRNIIIEVDGAAAGDLVFPMLHYDTGTIGEYEFGTVEGADLPVFVGGTVIFSPQPLTTEPVAAATEAPAAATEAAAASGACTVTPVAVQVNRRSGPSTDFSVVSQLAPGATATVTGQTVDATNIVWWQLDDGSFVRSDVVTSSGDCSAVPTMDPAQLPAAPPTAAPAQATVVPPNETVEPST
jgi:hypothetical protein